MPKIRLVRCEQCNERAQLEAIAPRAGQRIRWRWRCASCNSTVGCHGETKRALGTLADSALRRARIEAHEAFDPLWQRAMRVRGWSKSKARQRAYAWIAHELQLDASQTHIAKFDLAQCRRVVALCSTYHAHTEL